jgi:hypothetical protein
MLQARRQRKSRFDSEQRQKFSPFPQSPDRLWIPTSLLSSGYRGSFPEVEAVGRKADFSYQSNNTVNNKWKYNSSYFASMAESARKFEMSAIPPPPSEKIIHVSIELPWRYTAPPQSLKSSVVLLLLYCKKTVTVICPLPSIYCSIGSDSHTHRCFLWGSN